MKVTNLPAYQRLKEKFIQSGYSMGIIDDLPIYVVDNLDDAIKTARKYAKPSQIVLFSPASASFDMFKNAYDRGDKFKAAVREMVD